MCVVENRHHSDLWRAFIHTRDVLGMRARPQVRKADFGKKLKRSFKNIRLKGDSRVPEDFNACSRASNLVIFHEALKILG